MFGLGFSLFAFAVHARRGLRTAADAASIAYAESRCSAEPARFAALRDETRVVFPGGAHMVSGAQQGRLLHTLVRTSRATRVLEVGCFTGYAALWMALALPEGGRLVSLERDERAAEVARRHLSSAGVASRVELCMGDALESLQDLGEQAPFDLIFLDADKRRYVDYYELMRSRGLIADHSLVLADNMLWKGDVLDLLDDRVPRATDASGVSGRVRRSMRIRDALHDFSLAMRSDSRVTQLMLPLRDGLNWIQTATSWDDAARAVETTRLPAAVAVADAAAAADVAAAADAMIATAQAEVTSSDTTAPISAAPAATGAPVGAVSPGASQTPRRTDAVEVSGDRRLLPYLHLVGSPEPARFAALRDETIAAFPGSALLVSGAQQGRLLHTLVRMSRATRVLEVGCFTGYAALWMALALPEGGRLVSLERDERAAEVARRHLSSAGVASRVELRVGTHAVSCLDALPSPLKLGSSGVGASPADAFDVAVWHYGDGDGNDVAGASEGMGAQSGAQAGAPAHTPMGACAGDGVQASVQLHELLSRLAPHGVLVLNQPPAPLAPDVSEAVAAETTLGKAIAALGQSASVVALPSPEGDGGVVWLISRTAGVL